MRTQSKENDPKQRIGKALGMLAAGLLFAGLLAMGSPARAQGDGDVAVGGEHILTIRFGTTGMTVKQRADAVTERLVTILSDPKLKPADIYPVALPDKTVKIMVKDQLLVTIDAQTARYNQITPMGLAQVWVTHLRKVLPRVNVVPNPNDEKAGSAGSGQ